LAASRIGLGGACPGAGACAFSRASSPAAIPAPSDPRNPRLVQLVPTVLSSESGTKRIVMREIYHG
jgi:hypothetical protein